MSLAACGGRVKLKMTLGWVLAGACAVRILVLARSV
jgi:hypothetical protein